MSRTYRSIPSSSCFLRNMRVRNNRYIVQRFIDEVRDQGFYPRNRDKKLAKGVVSPWDNIPISSYREGHSYYPFLKGKQYKQCSSTNPFAKIYRVDALGSEAIYISTVRDPELGSMLVLDNRQIYGIANVIGNLIITY